MGQRIGWGCLWWQVVKYVVVYMHICGWKGGWVCGGGFA